MRLLVSANDPGAAFHLCEVLRQAHETGRMDVSLVAGEPARAVFERAGFKAHQVMSGRMGQEEYEGAFGSLEEADSLISRFSPDAILVGLSGPDRGVDEALVARAGNRPTYAIQDFWGDVNHGFGKLPETYFVLDEFAAKVTIQRAPSSKVIVTGSARHAAMTQLDPAGLRKGFRDGRGLAATDRAAVFYGQPLWNLPGYGATLSKLGGVLTRIDSGVKLYYRAHPKESREERAKALDCLRADGVAAQADDADTVELSLCGADLMVTCFSTCGLDLAYLARISATPLGVMVFAMFEEDIRQFYRATTSFDDIPLAAQGLAAMIGHEDGIESVIRAAQTEKERQQKWLAARETLDVPPGAAEHIVDVILRGRKD